MSQDQETNLSLIKKTQLLQSQWSLWFSYSCDQQNNINYGNNLMLIQKIHSWNQFALLWNWTSKIQNFFINPQDGTFKKYKFGLEERKVDSINFFKDNIQPQWEFGDNPKHGYFNFGIDKNNQNVNDIFEASVFLAVGSSQEVSKNILGVRIVDLSAKQTHPCRARIEIWVDFRHDSSKQSLQRLLNFQQKLQKYYKQSLKTEIDQIKFFNISNQEGDGNKTPKKQYNRKGLYQSKDFTKSKQ